MAKLVAGLLFAGLAWGVSHLAAQNLPEGASTRWLAEIDAVVGFVMGWRLLGARAGHGAAGALGLGVSTAAAIVLICLVFWGMVEMIDRSLARRYGGPVEALERAVAIMVDYAQLLLTGPVLAALAAGTVAASLMVEAIARRTR